MDAFWANLRAFFKKIDLLLLLLILGATAFGVVLIASATASYHSTSYLKVQLVSAGIGVVLYILLSLADLDSVCHLWKYLYVVNLLLIGSLLFFGVGGDETGNRAWIRFGSIGIQPAEFGKVLFILTLSGHMDQLREELFSLKSIGLLLVHGMIPIGMVIAISKDLGTAIIYIFIFIVMLFFAGLKLRWFFGAAALGAAATPLLWPRLNNYQKMRILVVFDPELDPLDKGYHAIQSKIALGAGGLFGRGLYRGTQTQYGYLPAKHTDFIFAVAGEELGLCGCLCIIALLSTIIIHTIVIGRRSAGSASSLACFGVAAMLIFQVIENVGMCLGLMPVIGITLPFFSYGGSSVLTMFIAAGIVSSAKMRAAPSWLSD